MKALIVVLSYHHGNTAKIVEVMAKVINAPIQTPQQTIVSELRGYDLVGFGSGIYSAKHHTELLDLADTLPKVDNKKAFIFSTSAIYEKSKMVQDHSALRDKLQSKGYVIVDEFSCRGFNTNSFLKYIGGMNRGRPNSEDLKNAQGFAKNLKQHELNQ
jgi:flavodoxin